MEFRWDVPRKWRRFGCRSDLGQEDVQVIAGAWRSECENEASGTGQGGVSSPVGALAWLTRE